MGSAEATAIIHMMLIGICELKASDSNIFKINEIYDYQTGKPRICTNNTYQLVLIIPVIDDQNASLPFQMHFPFSPCVMEDKEMPML